MFDIDTAMDKQALQSTYEIVRDAWFPANPVLLQQIKKKLSEDTYKEDAKLLFADIKKDFALYSYCLRSLVHLTQAEGSAHPSRIFEAASFETLTRSLSDASSALTLHSYSEMGSAQAQRMQEAMVSASTAELMASANQLDSELSFSAALLRQLGLTLIAWNYPTIFGRALEEQKKGKDLLKSLTITFGFSPMSLAASMAREWNLVPELRLVLGDKLSSAEHGEQSGEELLAAAKSLQKVCQTGEILARANSPQYYPSAKHDWKKAQTLIKGALGERGMWLVKKAILDNCQYYAEKNPGGFIAIEDLKAASASESPFERNKHIEGCSPQAQQALKDLYEQMQPRSISKEHILTLIKEVVPLAGFKCGCIYSFEPSLNQLMPRLSVSGAPLSSYETVDCSPLHSDLNLIRRAFESSAPIVEIQVWSPNQCCSIAAAYGSVQRVGVLLLETSPQLSGDSGLDEQTVFKAINQALMDCLKLS